MRRAVPELLSFLRLAACLIAIKRANISEWKLKRGRLRGKMVRERTYMMVSHVFVYMFGNPITSTTPEALCVVICSSESLCILGTFGGLNNFARFTEDMCDVQYVIALRTPAGFESRFFVGFFNL